jgi:hypothetical protein
MPTSIAPRKVNIDPSDRVWHPSDQEQNIRSQLRTCILADYPFPPQTNPLAKDSMLLRDNAVKPSTELEDITRPIDSGNIASGKEPIYDRSSSPLVMKRLRRKKAPPA